MTSKLFLTFTIVVALIGSSIAQQSTIDSLPCPSNVKDALKKVSDEVMVIAQGGSCSYAKLGSLLQAVVDALKANKVDVSSGVPAAISAIANDMKSKSGDVTMDYLKSTLASKEQDFINYLTNTFASSSNQSKTPSKTPTKLKTG